MRSGVYPHINLFIISIFHIRKFRRLASAEERFCLWFQDCFILLPSYFCHKFWFYILRLSLLFALIQTNLHLKPAGSFKHKVTFQGALGSKGLKLKEEFCLSPSLRHWECLSEWLVFDLWTHSKMRMFFGSDLKFLMSSWAYFIYFVLSRTFLVIMQNGDHFTVVLCLSSARPRYWKLSGSLPQDVTWGAGP